MPFKNNILYFEKSNSIRGQNDKQLFEYSNKPKNRL